MKKILVFGAGSGFRKFYELLDWEQVSIVAILDNDSNKIGNEINGIKIMSPNMVTTAEYDYIVVVSVWANNIKHQLVSVYNIDESKIIMYSTSNYDIEYVQDIFTTKGLMVAIHKRENEINTQNRSIFFNYLRHRAQNDAADFVYKNMFGPGNVGMDGVFNNREEYFDYIIESLGQRDGLYLEFGVLFGKSINYLAKKTGKCVKWYGFDSFTGFEEVYLPDLRIGGLTAEGILPKVEENVTLIKGYFNQTLPKFSEEHDEVCSLIHIDCDVYIGTKEILEYLEPKIISGTIIMFDDYLGDIDWQNREHRAFMEFIDKTGLAYQYIAHVASGPQIAVRII